MARAADKTQPLYDDDSDPDTEPDTPKPHKTSARRRISEAYVPDHDASFVSDSGVRGAHKPVDINDDAAEKRRRRKSTKIAVTESVQAINDGQDQADTSRTAKQKQQLTTVAPPSGPDEPLDILSTKYEEWMKIATDNKITVVNTWNFALIDYFHEMSLLRNTDDNSINFQRASHTLDGCVKIWTSRVDSVGTETAKLASNLASGGTADDDDEAGSDDPDGEQVKEKKKRNHRTGATLAKDPSQLRIKKLDLEFSVDPLFRKTCADFDEGGAQGLLMNHLSLGVGQDGSLRVVFDASDSVSKVDEEEDIQEPEDLIDLSQLRSEFLPDISVLDDKAISHSLADFSFSKNAFSNDDTFFQDNTQQEDDDDDDFGPNIPMDNEAEAPPVEDFFVGDDAVADDYGGGDMMGGDDYGDNNSNGSVGPTDDGQDRQSGSFVPFDPRQMPNQRDLVLAMNEDGEEAMDYFDKAFLKNWAGPEHWKMRKVIRRPEADPAAKTAKPRKEKKEPNRIDFLTPADKGWKEISQELFAPPGKGVSINLPGTSATAKKRKTRDEKKRDDHCLPDDMHFSKKQLITLFLKPKFSLQMRGRRVPNPTNDGDIDENFWAQAAAEQTAGRNRDEDLDETAEGGAIPFNTQFFHDDYDDGPGFDDPYDGDGGDGAPIDPDEQDLLAGTQGPTRRVKVERIKYTKRAKRVDVRKLKENIWKGLDIVVPPPKKSDDDEMDVDENVPPATDPSEARPFTSVISNLQQSYPRDKMQDISTSFCFICLLHLANEQGLKLESDAVKSSDSDGMPETKIGNIWDLKVYRDPEATRIA